MAKIEKQDGKGRKEEWEWEENPALEEALKALKEATQKAEEHMEYHKNYTAPVTGEES